MRNGRWIGQRADSLAYVFMTRDARVAVLAQDDNETGVDFVIRVGTTPRQVDWTAGVLVKGVEQPPKQSRLELTDRQIAALEQSRHPTFLLVVDVRSEHLYFAWLRRPCDEGAENSVPRRVSLDPVDDASFKAHVDEIRSYYKKTPAVTPMSTLPAIPALFDEWLLVT